MLGFSKPPAAKVLDLLHEQRDALLNGNLDKLSHMAPAIEQALARLHTAGGEKSELLEIQALASRNALLLQAAQKGVGQARGHLERAKSTTLTTYDARGQSQRAPSATGRTLSRR